MILEEVNFFSGFFRHIESIFLEHFDKEETDTLMEFVEVLMDANFRCYRANMLVIEERKKDFPSDKLISNLEWVARSVGEYRVASKARINKFISNFYSKNEPKVSESIGTDDVVYSIGEMMDRLSIEAIKREDFRINNRPIHMMKSCQDLSDRVEKYLIAKLEEVDEKGFYECVHEQRTYDLEGIVKELVI